MTAATPSAADNAPTPRKGQGDVKLTREDFARKLAERFDDPAFDEVRSEIDRVIEIAWRNYDEYRKSPRRRAAGAGYADPAYELPGGQHGILTKALLDLLQAADGPVGVLSSGDDWK